MSAQVLAGHQVQLSGSVTGGSGPIGLMFSGAVAGSATTDGSGNFSYTTSEATLGTVYASGTGTDTASATVAVTPPSFSGLSITYGSQRNVTVVGTLVSIDAAGRSVGFAGAATGMATTSSTGYFSITIAATTLGAINVSETDLWGQTSSDSVTVASAAPVILNFAASNIDGNSWTFTGSVQDESAAGLTINFGGLTGLFGATATVQANGSFSFTVVLSADVTGTASALTTDWWGLNSETAYCYVS